MKKSLVLTFSVGLFACNLVSPQEVVPPTATNPETVIPTQAQEQPVATQEVPVKFEISSPAFSNGAPIPVQFSCKGADITPALTWTEPPPGTVSFSLVMDDPDAPMGTWVHWVIFNLPASVRGLPEDMPTDTQLADGSLQGITSAGRNGYHGPCPPSGTHRYFFKLYALDATLALTSSAGKEQVLAAMEGHILASTELMGTFRK